MTYADDFVAVMRDDLLINRIGLESLVWAEGSAKPIYLDPIATVLMDILDGRGTLAELVEDVDEALDVSADVARVRITEVLDHFGAGGLLSNVEPPADLGWERGTFLLPEPDW